MTDEPPDRSELPMTKTEKQPGGQTGADAQAQDPEIGPGTQPGDDSDESGSPGGRP